MDSRKQRIWVIWGAVIILVLTFGTLTAQESEAYTDTTDLTEHLRGTLNTISLLTKSDSLPVFYLFLDTLYCPAQGVKCVLETKKGIQEKYSDINGEVLFWVARRQRFKIEFNVYSGQPVNCYSSATGCIEIGDSADVVDFGFFESVGLVFKLMRRTRQAPLKISYGMPEVWGQGIRVLYPEGYKKEAEEILEQQIKCKEVIDSLFRMRLMPLKFVIEDEHAPSGFRFDGAWSVSPSKNSEFVLGMPSHEWVESSFGNIYLGESSEYDTRWIGDGLANYAMFELERLYNPDGNFLLHNEELMGFDPEKTYDLRTWEGGEVTDFEGGKSVGLAGYLIAPYFWAKVVEKSGNRELIPAFLKEYRLSEDKSSEAAIGILTELSGLDIEQELVITGQEFRENVSRYWPQPDSVDGDDSAGKTDEATK